MKFRAELFASLHERQRVETVCRLLVPSLPELQLDATTSQAIEMLARTESCYGGYSSMGVRFRAAEGFSRQVKRAESLFKIPFRGDADDSLAILHLAERVNSIIARKVGENDFKTDRKNREARAAAGVVLSNHHYNRLFRFLVRIDEKRERFRRETLKCNLAQIAKSRLAFALPEEDATASTATLAFLAYFTARCNRRSVFTNTAQERPYDTIAHALFSRCQVEADTSWWAIAHVYPDPRVLLHLDDAAKGRLLGLWTAWLERASELLEATAQVSTFDRATMIVKRGSDSSTWNAAAGGWNKIRDAWINLLHDLGFESVLDSFCPGKVMRLMAADVAQWHQQSGSGIDPDTQVWAALPPPWEVFQRRAHCGRRQIDAACRAANIDPGKRGWIIPRTHGIAPVTPTPELVWGVAVANPFLADLLKATGTFSGKLSER